ncbi:hypothetical protein BD626DRAFT_480410 [Schizophyllum amplum]|uniref:Ubiquitin-like-conjugating enzyme ATG10 n=1 Tax=Schizophyllum amplum TaxID=97359 RepID=A0A550CT54_9AGAR|nr:hypothetical protein BD626DRAFT_480410 [Auriculariopsis ampla]
MTRERAIEDISKSYVGSDIDALQSDELAISDDAAASQSDIEQSLSCHQYVVYSAGFQVPAFYFTIHDSGGSPLRIDDLVRTSLFRPAAFETTERNSFAVTPSASTFPLLSQGDHPILGTPCWYLHPCETATALREIVSELQCDDGDSRERCLTRTLKAWFMVLSSIVDLQQGKESYNT